MMKFRHIRYRWSDKVSSLLLVFIGIFWLSASSQDQWTVQQSNTSEHLKDIHFLNDTVGFAVGTNSTFLKTVDGGETWITSALDPPGETLNAVFALNPDTLFAGGHENLYKSTDGGENWTILSDQFHIYEIKFFSDLVGFIKSSWIDYCYYPNFNASSTRFEFYRTLDGGETWSPFSGFSRYFDGWAEIVILSPDTGYFGEMTWSFNCGYFPCCEEPGQQFYKTTDGGLTWEILDPWFGGGALSRVSFLNGHRGFAVKEIVSPYGHYGAAHLYKTTNGGLSFLEFGVLPFSFSESIEFVNDNEGYYLEGTKIFKSRSEGLIWAEDYSHSAPLKKIEFTENDHAFIIGNSGAILHQKLEPAATPDPVFWMNCNKSQLQFPMTNLFGESILEFTLKATGNQAIVVDIQGDGYFMVKTEGDEEFSPGIEGLTIPARHDTVISVAFRPDSPQSYQAGIQVTSNATNAGNIQIAVSGRGVYMVPASITTDTSFCWDTIFVMNSVTVNSGSRLSFCPGTVICFDGRDDLVVQGSLRAVGTPSDSIIFTGSQLGEYWKGFRINGNNPEDSVILRYCVIQNAEKGASPPELRHGSGLCITGNNRVIIEYSRIRRCYSGIWGGFSSLGGGIYCSGPNLTLRNVEIYSCNADYGGGIYFRSDNDTLAVNCMISDCYGSDGGGGIYCNGNNVPVVSGCTITGCGSKSGGGIAITGPGARIDSCLIEQCSANFSGSGGGLHITGTGQTVITRTGITDCTAPSAGGIYATASVSLSECKVTGNDAENSGGGIWLDSVPSAVISHCNIEGNNANEAGGILAENSVLDLSHCTVSWNNSFQGYGGAVHGYASELSVINNQFTENRAASLGGAIFLEGSYLDHPHRIIQNLFLLNGVYYEGKGGTIYIRGCRADVISTTISGYMAGQGESIYLEGTENVRVISTILTGQSDSQLVTENASGTVVSWCDIRGGWSGPGQGNFFQDPEFFKEYQYWPQYTYDYSLKETSPCIDKGLPDTTGWNLPMKDIAGNPRICNERMDIGAYESNFLFQSSDTGVCLGQSLSLEVMPVAAGPFHYQWYFNDNPIPQSDNPVLTIENATALDQGYYHCVLAGPHPLTSRKILVEYFGTLAQIIEQPEGATLNEGDSYTLMFQVYAQGDVNFLWYFNDIPMEGATEYYFPISYFTIYNVGYYQCRLEGVCGNLWSDKVELVLANADVEEVNGFPFIIRPNPAGDNLVIEGNAQGAVTSPIKEISIMNLQGSTILTEYSQNLLPLALDVTTLNKGMYLLRVVTDENTVFIKKLMISR